MNITRATLLSALTAIAVLPTAAPAQDEDELRHYENEIEVGAGYVTESSAKFGEYSGIDDQGALAIGSFRLGKRPQWDGDSREHWRITGTDLGLDSRSMSATYGMQGRYKLRLEYDEIPHRRFDDARTPFVGVGTGNFTVPPGWVAARSTQGMTQLNPSLRTVTIETDRKRLTGDMQWIPARNWDMSAKFRHETKEGLDALFVAFATNGGNPSALQIPELIDYETNEMELGVGYGNGRGQFRVGYQLSLFDNRSATTRFQNPYSTQFSGGPWAAATRFPTGVGETTGAPDNMAHSLTLAGGYNLSDTTRLTANVAWTRMTQDERLLGFSANPLLTVNTPVPRVSLDGQIDRLIVDLGGSMRPTRALDLRASYRFQDLDNSTPQDVYVRIAGDAQNQPAGIANGNARINVPYSFRQHLMKVKGGYRLHPSAKLSLGYSFEQRDRDDVDVSRTREHTASAKLSGTPLDMVNGWLEYAHAWRDGSSYQGNAGFLAGHTPEFLATLAPGADFENDPRFRRAWLADRDRDTVKGRVNYQVSDAVALGFDAGWSRDDYDSSPLGVQDVRHANGTVDVSWVPRETLRLHGYVTYDNFQQNQVGCSFGGGNQQCINTPPAPERTWSARINDDVYTVGFAAKWNVIKNKLDAGFDYSFSKAITEVDIASGSAIGPALPFPDITSRVHGIGIHTEYRFKEDLSLRFAYRYQQLSTRDWALDGVEPDTIGRVLTFGSTSPDYAAHLFGVAVKYRF